MWIDEKAIFFTTYNHSAVKITTHPRKKLLGKVFLAHRTREDTLLNIYKILKNPALPFRPAFCGALTPWGDFIVKSQVRYQRALNFRQITNILLKILRLFGNSWCLGLKVWKIVILQRAWPVLNEKSTTG